MRHLLVIWRPWRKLSCPRSHVKHFRGNGASAKAYGPDASRINRPGRNWRMGLLQPMLFKPFEVSRILETSKFPVSFPRRRLERLERSEAVERLELAIEIDKCGIACFLGRSF